MPPVHGKARETRAFPAAAACRVSALLRRSRLSDDRRNSGCRDGDGLGDVARRGSTGQSCPAQQNGVEEDRPLWKCRTPRQIFWPRSSRSRRVGFVNSAVADLQGNRAGAREARLADRVAAVTLATAAPPFSLWSRAEDASRRTASLPDGTEKSLANAHAPARVALLCPPPCEVAAERPEATGSGFPWKSVTTEFTNPTGATMQERVGASTDSSATAAQHDPPPEAPQLVPQASGLSPFGGKTTGTRSCHSRQESSGGHVRSSGRHSPFLRKRTSRMSHP